VNSIRAFLALFCIPIIVHASHAEPPDTHPYDWRYPKQVYAFEDLEIEEWSDLHEILRRMSLGYPRLIAPSEYFSLFKISIDSICCNYWSYALY